MKIQGDKLLVGPFILELTSFLVLCCISAPFIYLGHPVGILLGFYSAIEFQRRSLDYIISKGVAKEYKIEAKIVKDQKLTGVEWSIWAHNSDQAKEFFWQETERKNVDVIGEIEIAD